MKYFVQYNNVKDDHWVEDWNFKFVIYDYTTKNRIYIRPNETILRKDKVFIYFGHENNQTKVVKYDN